MAERRWTGDEIARTGPDEWVRREEWVRASEVKRLREELDRSRREHTEYREHAEGIIARESGERERLQKALEQAEQERDEAYEDSRMKDDRIVRLVHKSW